MPEKVSVDTRVQMKDAITSLPDDASWDNVWQQLLTSSVQVSSVPGVDGDARVQIKDVITSLPDDASWDNVWQQLLTASVQVSSVPGVDLAESPERGDSVTNMGSQSSAEADDASASGLRRKGTRFKVIAFLVLIAGFSGMGLLDGFITDINQIHKVLIYFSTTALLYLTYLLHREGRYYAQKAKELVTIDSRAPVIYLRSFAADQITMKVKASGISEEEQIVGILHTIGPVISLDNPVEEVAAPGAKRISVDDLEWQNRVLQLIQKAQLVVIRLGDTPSLHWEITLAKQILQPEKLLLIVPLQKLFDYKEFKLKADRELGIKIRHTDFSESISQTLMRVLTRGRQFRDYYSFQGFVYFDDNWNGRVAVPRFTWKGQLHSPFSQPGRGDITYVLKPVFERVGASKTMLPFNWLMLMLLIAIGGGGIVGLLAHLFGESF